MGANSDNQYRHIAAIYSHLMRGIDYKFWAEYIGMITQKYVKKDPLTLEIAAGNCSLAKYLRKYYKNYIAADLSAEMLMNSKRKKISRVCCDMRSLPFRAKFDLIISAFDSVNYLTSANEISRFLANLKNNLSDNGIFTFDISLESNSIKYVKNLNRFGQYKGISYEQISSYDKRKKVHYNEFVLKLKDGREVYEEHKQKIYSLETFFDLIGRNGYIVKECYTAFSLDNANENSERAQFIIKKGKNAYV